MLRSNYALRCNNLRSQTNPWHGTISKRHANKQRHILKSKMGLVATKPVGLPKKRDSNQSGQLQGLDRKLKIPLVANLDIILTKGAGQTAGMRRLVCAFVVRIPPKTGFLTSRSKNNLSLSLSLSLSLCEMIAKLLKSLRTRSQNPV